MKKIYFLCLILGLCFFINYSRAQEKECDSSQDCPSRSCNLQTGKCDPLIIESETLERKKPTSHLAATQQGGAPFLPCSQRTNSTDPQCTAGGICYWLARNNRCYAKCDSSIITASCGTGEKSHCFNAGGCKPKCYYCPSDISCANNGVCLNSAQTQVDTTKTCSSSTTTTCDCFTNCYALTGTSNNDCISGNALCVLTGSSCILNANAIPDSNGKRPCRCGSTPTPTPTPTPTLTAVNDSYNVLPATVLTVPAPGVLGNDIGVTMSTTVSIVVGSINPSGSNVTLNPDGSFTYTPNVFFTGSSVSFTYRATDSVSGLMSDATVTINIQDVTTPCGFALAGSCPASSWSCTPNTACAPNPTGTPACSCQPVSTTSSP
ncbi:MAG: Ig-like domain-containing protein [Candidatus Melainabacteria bacterium]|nr:Ig-like domain-containing protein [Candidatus Melainabacteria bacterium]